MFTTILRVIRFAAQNFWRNVWLSVATVTMLVLTLIVVTFLISVQVIGGEAVRQVEEKIDVTVAMKLEVTEQVVSEIRTYLESLAQVQEVNIIKPEEALATFIKRHEGNPQVLRSLEEVGENPFGFTLTVRARSPRDYPFILEVLENPTYREFIEDTNFVDHERLISRLNSLVDRVRNFGVILAGFFAAIAVLIIFNTIRVAIYTYREEIGIMKLVGASNWFVRAPFLLEGVIYSILAVAILALITFPVLAIIEPALSSFFDGISLELVAFFRHNWLAIFGGELLALIILNTISSSIALGRYLKT